jgi:drug/metabolite transporter (DMT)-like permease
MDIISWPFLTMVTLVFFVASILVDKYMLNHVRDPMVYWAIDSFISLAAALLVWSVVGISIQQDLIVIALAIGAMSVLSSWTYYHALRVEEASRAYTLMQMSMPMTVVFSAVFLGEIFGLLTYVGIALLLVGAILLSTRLDTKLRKLVRSAALPYALGTAVIFTVMVITRKWLLFQADWLQIFALGSFGSWLGFMALLYYRRSELRQVLRQPRWIAWSMVSSILTAAGVVALTLAYSIGPAALVSALSSAQPALLFIAALGISIWRPKILYEELRGSTIVVKAVAIALVVIGSLLITS